MMKSIPATLFVLSALGLVPHQATAADLIDAPGRGYQDQASRFSRPKVTVHDVRMQVDSLKQAMVVPTNGANFVAPLAESPKTDFSQPIHLTIGIR